MNIFYLNFELILLNIILFTFDQLSKVYKIKGPKFTFAHIFAHIFINFQKSSSILKNSNLVILNNLLTELET